MKDSTFSLLTNSRRLRYLVILFAVLSIHSGLHAEDRMDIRFGSDVRSRFPVFAFGQDVAVEVKLHRDDPSKTDKIECKVCDYLGNTIYSKSLPVPKGVDEFSHTLSISKLPAGYLEFHAQLESSGLVLPRKGSMPPGMASFGVLTRLTALIPAQPDEARFGIQGTNFIESGKFMQGDPFTPYYSTLGARWVNMNRNWSNTEPDHAGQFLEGLKKKNQMAEDPSVRNYEAEANLVPLVHMAGLPQWAMDYPPNVTVEKNASHVSMGYPPKDYQQYTDYLTEVSKDCSASREKKFSGLTNGYYQVGWEPDWHWKGTDEQFLKLYAAAYKGLHAGDPKAVILGPGYGVMAKGVKLLERLLPMGLANSLDGIAIHGYYLPFGNPNAVEANGKLISPEDGGAIENMRKLRGLMSQYFKPGARLIQTEWGLPYKTPYLELPSELLRLQAAYIIRGHLIFLGEGCDMTYFFYTADYGRLDKLGEDGYGLCFNMTMPNPSFGATDVAPKPVFMAACTLTRILEGTKTIGPVDTKDPALCAYLFKRNGENVLTLWTRDNSTKKLNITLAKSKGMQIDFMGNMKPKKGKNGSIEVEVNQYPTYILGTTDAPLSAITRP